MTDHVHQETNLIRHMTDMHAAQPETACIVHDVMNQVHFLTNIVRHVTNMQKIRKLSYN